MNHASHGELASCARTPAPRLELKDAIHLPPRPGEMVQAELNQLVDEADVETCRPGSVLGGAAELAVPLNADDADADPLFAFGYGLGYA